MFLVWHTLFSRCFDFHEGSCNVFTTAHKKPNILSCVNILLKSVVSLKIYIRFSIYLVQNNVFATIIYLIIALKLVFEKRHFNASLVYNKINISTNLATAAFWFCFQFKGKFLHIYLSKNGLIWWYSFLFIGF